MSGLYLGYDPGGGGAHGVAAIDDRQAMCDTILTAEHAIAWFRERCPDLAPSAFGVDTLTLWSTGPAGWRPADRALRAAYPEVASSVMSPNRLYGAMPINGVAVTLALRENFPTLSITETHPKVLYFALTGAVYDFAEHRDQMVQNLVGWLGLGACEVSSEHAWDALVSAFAAREWNRGNWQDDLHQLPLQPNESLIPAHGSEAYYAWPKSVPPAPVPQEQERAPRREPGLNAPRRWDRWRVAVERLERAGHDDVAQQVADYRNARNERSGWDAWLKANFPALWILVEDPDH